MRLPFSGCPDKTCKKLARKPLVIGFMCVGRLANPTDHVVAGVNDLCFCFKQKGHLNKWHMNRADITILTRLFDKAMKNDGGEHALHQTGATEEHRPGD